MPPILAVRRIPFTRSQVVQRVARIQNLPRASFPPANVIPMTTVGLPVPAITAPYNPYQYPQSSSVPFMSDSPSVMSSDYPKEGFPEGEIIEDNSGDEITEDTELTGDNLQYVKELFKKKYLSSFEYAMLEGYYDNEIQHLSFKSIGKFISRNIKSAGKDIKKLSIKKIIKGLKRVVYAPLLPFKGAMKKGLDKKGITYDNHIDDIADKFFSNIVKGKKSYDEKEHIAPLVIIGAILSFLKMLNQKKEEGGEMSPVENTILDSAQNVAEKIVNVSGEINEKGKELLGKQVEIENSESGKPEGITMKGNTKLILIIVGFVVFIVVILALRK